MTGNNPNERWFRIRNAELSINPDDLAARVAALGIATPPDRWATTNTNSGGGGASSAGAAAAAPPPRPFCPWESAMGPEDSKRILRDLFQVRRKPAFSLKMACC